MRAINRNKIIAVMAAIVVFMVSMCTYSAEANATNTSRTYKVYNAQTGAYLQQRDYTLGAFDTYPNVNSGNARSLIGKYDERLPDWTKSGVCKILLDGGGFGSGFVVDEHIIATAAHCVKNLAISEILLFNTNGTISLSATPVEYHYPEIYSTDYCDYALITVEEDLSDYMCFNLGVALDSFSTNNPAVSVTGFSGDLNNDNDNTHTMYTGTGAIIDLNSAQIFHTADTGGGNSGGPIYITESRGGHVYFTVIAIHTNGEHYGVPGNRGARISTDELQFYYNNPNIIYE